MPGPEDSGNSSQPVVLDLTGERMTDGLEPPDIQDSAWDIPEAGGLSHPIVGDAIRFRHERMRDVLAMGLLGLAVLIVLGLFALLMRHDIGVSDAKDLAAVMLASVVTLLGAVIGFFFGGHDKF